MSEGWPNVRLSEVLTPYQKYVETLEPGLYPKLSVKLYGKGVVLDSSADASTLKMKRHQLARAGQVILSEIWGKKGAIGFVPQKGEGALCTSHFFLFDVRTEKVDPKWLQAIFNANYLQDQLDAEAKGTTGYAAVKPKILLGCEIPLPPLAEQQRLVARIDVLAAKIHEARVLRQQVTEESVALSYSTLRTIRERLSASSYSKARLSTVTRVTSGGTPSRDNPAFWNGGIPWVKTGELVDEDISRAEEHITQAGVENSSAKVFPQETVLVALYGQGQTRGRTGRLLIPAATNQACCAILPNPDRFEARYIQFWLRSLYVELREDSKGGAQPNWNGALIKALEIVLPPLPEQRRIVEYLDDLQEKTDALKALQAETSTELDALIPSILDKAFRGEL
jgi:type I restriction enzyme S subunit